jgi:methylated-DNA-[protein]-cysteine S-methyltransferase
VPALIYSVFAIPGGELTVVCDLRQLGDRGEQEYGAVVAATYRGLADAMDRLDEAARPRRADLGSVAGAIAGYLDQDLTALDAVSVRQQGGPFQQQTWTAMRTISPGTIDSYGGLARRAGRPRAARAVGTACSSNLVALFVPCHRVVAANGIGGYGYGLDVKRALLAHEDADPDQPR